MRKPSIGQDRHDSLLRLRKAGARRIAALGLPDPCDLATLCRRLQEVRNRPITLVPVSMAAPQPCGIWVAARQEDLIFYDANTTRAHQEHIILHELGHIICCHRGAGMLDDRSARELFPDLDPAIVRDMLMRETYDDVQEQEAEISAYLLSERIGRSAPVESVPAGDVLDRVERTLL